MTLITYPTRVHFADYVLEEALHSELESAGCRRPLLIAEQAVWETELADRVRGGLPRGARPLVLRFASGTDLRTAANEAMDAQDPVDVIVAFGTARAIELGRKCRHVQTRKTNQRPALFGIPGVDGLPNPCTRNMENWRAGLPSVLICDPTVSLTAGQGDCLQSSVLSLARCVESYLALAYNPPADGIALEGVSRCVINLPKIRETSGINLLRELMAAGLNAALSQEKGMGPALTMTESLAQSIDGKDQAAIARLVLPGVMQARAFDGDKASVLGKVLGDSEQSLDQVMTALWSDVPLPSSLSGIGVPHRALDDAARAAAGTGGLSYDRARAILEAIYEDAEA